MAIKNALLGGTDNVNGDVIDADDVNDTNDAIITTYMELNSQRYGDSVISGCEVTEQGTPDQTVAVASGKILIGGLYYDVSADTVLNLSAADGSNPRWDLISVDSNDTLTVTDGTAASSPVVPTLPNDEASLAVIYRAANDNVINEVNITDSRKLVANVGNEGWVLISDNVLAGSTLTIEPLPDYKMFKIVFKKVYSISGNRQIGLRIDDDNSHYYYHKAYNGTFSKESNDDNFLLIISEYGRTISGELILSNAEAYGDVYRSCTLSGCLTSNSSSGMYSFFGGNLSPVKRRITKLYFIHTNMRGNIEIWGKN